MPEASTNSYTLSEVAQIIGVDEKTLHLYAHKGLLDPALLADSTTRFTDVDCARLAVIKRANELGYESENIFDLIGSPDEVINVADPVSACQQFAMKKYKQIFNELNDCEPLEQLNKKCDLKLLKNYIMNLEGRKDGSLNSVRRSNAAPQAKPRHPIHPARQPSSSGPHENAAQTPRVLSYSVDKLWDYVKKDDPSQTDDALSRIHGEAEPQDGILPDESMDDTILSEMSMRGFAGSPPLDRLMKSRWWPTGYKEYKNILTKPTWRNWIFSVLILALAITGLVKILGPAQKTPQQQITAGSEAPGQLPVQEPRPAPDSEQPTMPDKEQTITAQNESAQRQPTDPVPAPETLGDQDAAESDPGKAAFTRPDQAAEQEEPSPEEPSEPTVAAVEKPEEAQLPAPMQIKDLSLWHDNLNNIYRAELTLQKNEAVMGKDPISGYVFVHLATGGEETADSKGLLLPRGRLESGIPSQIRRGASFSIKNFIQMRIKGVSELPPNDVSSGKVLIYSSEGILLLEQAFNVPIQPFFTAVKEQEPPPPQPAEKETEQEAAEGVISETIAESGKPVVPEPPITQPKTIASVPTTTKEADAPPTDRTEAASSEQAQPIAPVEAPRTAEKVKPIGNLQKTDNPDAAIWEQKSYEAAVRGDFDIAIADATKAIELDPGRVNPYINRSWAYIEKNMLEHAIRDCKAALQIDPKNMLAYNNRGLAFQRRAQFPQAQEDYRKACDLGLELGCQNLDGLINQSRILELINQSQTAFRNKNWDGVIRAATKVIDLDPKNAVAYTNRSAAYAQKSYLAKALKDSNEAIRHNPNFSLAYNNRGYVYELLGNTRKAAADYLKSCSLGLNLGCKNFDKLN
jgi:tetratricopeptide (TPR) repeat protein/DNA-binding transcriptional MerR regulator